MVDYNVTLLFIVSVGGESYMKISELASIANVSKRTLHYYDEIGLLTPTHIDENGYRIYSEQNIDQLQQILFFRQLDMPLKQIKQLIEDPTYDATEALHVHKQILLQKRKKLDELMRTIDKTIDHMKGMTKMSHQEKFTGFDFSENPYEKEARKMYGNEAVNQANKQFTPAFGVEMNDLFKELAALRHLDVKEEEVQTKIANWYNMLNQIGTYTYEAFASLGEMYVLDERFTANIDQFGEGLAAWMAEAMKVFANEQQK